MKFKLCALMNKLFSREIKKNLHLFLKNGELKLRLKEKNLNLIIHKLMISRNKMFKDQG